MITNLSFEPPKLLGHSPLRAGDAPATMNLYLFPATEEEPPLLLWQVGNSVYRVMGYVPPDPNESGRPVFVEYEYAALSSAKVHRRLYRVWHGFNCFNAFDEEDVMAALEADEDE